VEENWDSEDEAEAAEADGLLGSGFICNFLVASLSLCDFLSVGRVVLPSCPTFGIRRRHSLDRLTANKKKKSDTSSDQTIPVLDAQAASYTSYPPP